MAREARGCCARSLRRAGCGSCRGRWWCCGACFLCRRRGEEGGGLGKSGRGWRRARGNTRRCRSNGRRGVELLLDMRQRATLFLESAQAQGQSGQRDKGGTHTPPSPSFTTSTNPLRNPRKSSHFLYSVPKLTPSCSRLYTRFHSSHSCNRGGTRRRISSARARVSNCADCAVPEW